MTTDDAGSARDRLLREELDRQSHQDPLRGSRTSGFWAATVSLGVVLVLLIVFIVMVPGLSKAMKVVVPQVVQTTDVKPPDPNNILIQVDQDGTMTLQQDTIDAQGLKDRLPEAVMLQPLNYRKVFLKVDEDVKFQAMVDVLDAIRVASEAAKKKSLELPDKFLGQDGGDVKVAVSLKKRPAAETTPVS